jgi:DNA polymerase III delta prime subunit
MDAFLDGESIDTEVNSTPNIEFQLDKYNEKEFFTQKHIPEEAFFIPTIFLNKLKQLIASDLDLPLLIYGLKGCGKFTAILGIINYVSEDNINDTSKVTNLTNNVLYMKILDKEYEKLLVYENVYYLNIKILSNTSEITYYLKHIYNIGKNRSIDCGKKIIIIAHIEKCNLDGQKYINYILDRLSANTSYIFTTTNLNNINNKIKSSCANIYFGYLNETEFSKIFAFNYKTNNIFESKHFLPEYIKNYYQIYVNNQYNIGNTISQIKYIIDTKDVTLEKLKTDEYRQSLMYNIVKNFIKNKLKLSIVNNALEIRKFLYTILSLNIDLLEFSTYLIKQLLASKINDKSKALLITKSGELSYELQKINKEVISVESFIYDIIYIIYSGGKE